MKLGLTAKALALAVAVGITSQAMAETTTGWWDINFENVSAFSDLTNETVNAFSGIGAWTIAEEDESSIIVDGDEVHATNYLKLDTQGTDLVWTPSAVSTEEIVLVNADIYLVGSDSEPTGFDTDTEHPVQSAVYLKNYVNDDNETTNSVLCAYIADTESANKWVELSGYKVVDTNWYTIKIEVNYAGDDPHARFIVNDTVMSAGAEENFLIANYTQFSNAKRVNSVSFRGTGAVDNFIGQQVTPDPAAELQFTVVTYTDEVQDGTAYIAGSSTGHKVNAGETYFVDFRKFDGSEAGDKPLSLVRVYTIGSTVTNDYVVTYDAPDFTYDLPLVTQGFNIRLNIATTLGMTEGQTVEAYYGTHPPLVEDPPTGDPTVPVIGGGDIGENAPIAIGLIEGVEYFSVTFAAPEGGVTYTLQTAENLGDEFVDSEDNLAIVNSVDENDVITLSTPTGGATKMFFRVKAETSTPAT